MTNKYCGYIDYIIAEIKKYQLDCGDNVAIFETIKNKMITKNDFDNYDLKNINNILRQMLFDSSVRWSQLDCWRYLNMISLLIISKITYKYDVGIICSVRTGFDKDYIEKYVDSLEQENIRVFYPARDTKQEDSTGGIRICRDNKQNFINSYEIHVIFHPESQGSLFDLGICFEKPIHIVNPIIKTDNKSFKNVLLALHEETKHKIIFSIPFNKEIEIR